MWAALALSALSATAAVTLADQAATAELIKARLRTADQTRDATAQGCLPGINCRDRVYCGLDFQCHDCSSGTTDSWCDAWCPCRGGYSCQPIEQKCYDSPRKLKQPCSAGFDCGPGLSCQPFVQKCFHHPRQLDEPCSIGFDCAPGLVCEPGTQKCKWGVPYGGDCDGITDVCMPGLRCFKGKCLCTEDVGCSTYYRDGIRVFNMAWFYPLDMPDQDDYGAHPVTRHRDGSGGGMPKCDQDRGVCGECNTNADCPSLGPYVQQFCLMSQYVSPRTTDTGVPGYYKACSTSNGHPKGTPCIRDVDCFSRKCEGSGVVVDDATGAMGFSSQGTYRTPGVCA